MTVTFPSRNGLIRRAWVVPANPQTVGQLQVRGRLATQAAGYDALTEAQQDAWVAAALQVQSKPRLGQSGPLTGLQLFVKLNANLTLVGEPAINAPADRPTFDSNVCQSLELTNVSNVIALKLVCSGSSDAFNLVWGCAPQKSGTRRPLSWRYLGELPEVVSGKADLTTLYANKFGTPAVGQRVFVKSVQMAEGWQDNPVFFHGLIPASS